MRGIQVICEDGVRRHRHPFTDLAEAAEWLDQGHLCTVRHTIEPFDRAPANPTPRAVVDHDRGRLSVLVTFDWRRPWALDACEAGVVVGELRRLAAEHFAGWDQLAGLAAVETWEPLEERHIGDPVRLDPIRFDHEGAPR